MIERHLRRRGGGAGLRRLEGRIAKAGLGGDAWRAADELSASCDRIHPSLRNSNQVRRCVTVALEGGDAVEFRASLGLAPTFRTKTPFSWRLRHQFRTEFRTEFRT